MRSSFLVAVGGGLLQALLALRPNDFDMLAEVEEQDLSPCVGEPDPQQQLNGEVLKVICEKIQRSGTNFLVFGLGRDSDFWYKNTNTKVTFLENHQDWLQYQSESVLARTHVVNYTTEMKDYKHVLGDTAKLAEFSGSLPSEVVDTRWDVILVDSPMGMEDPAGEPLLGIPGRMQSISAALELAHKGTIIFVDDYQRHVERASADVLLAPHTEEPIVFDNGHGGKTAMFVVDAEHTHQAAPGALLEQPDLSPCLGQPDPQQQLNGEVLKVICEQIQKSGATFLVFGLGRDSDFWYKNTNTKVTFLENHQDWLQYQGESVLAATHVVNYTTEMKDYENVLNDTAKLGEFFDSLPPDVVGARWDVILVDSPMGMEDPTGKPQLGIPGRMQSISAALALAHSGTIIFVDDYQRHVERASADVLLAPRAVAPTVFDNGHGGKTAMFIVH